LDKAEQYLLGLLSLLPAMLRIPMNELAPRLPLRGEICRALEGEKTPERALLCWIEGHEHGDWRACDMVEEKMKLQPGQLQTCYHDALAWTEAALHFA
jgi:EAL and modified HD-GYP domain-containing signal transduction protein